MKTKNLITACSVFVMAISFASTTFAYTEEPPPETCLSGCEPPPAKGNNGWGNGIDGTNPGSDAGPPAQVETKNNRDVWEKFEGKFEGR